MCHAAQGHADDGPDNLVISGLSFVLVSVAAADQPRRTITVQGTGISGAVPDLAEVSAGALTRASTATKALAENNAVVGNVLALVADFDIPDRDVRTGGFSLTPIFERQQQRGNNAQAPTIIGYFGRCEPDSGYKFRLERP